MSPAKWIHFQYISSYAICNKRLKAQYQDISRLELSSFFAKSHQSTPTLTTRAPELRLQSFWKDTKETCNLWYAASICEYSFNLFMRPTALLSLDWRISQRHQLSSSTAQTWQTKDSSNDTGGSDRTRRPCDLLSGSYLTLCIWHTLCEDILLKTKSFSLEIWH